MLGQLAGPGEVDPFSCRVAGPGPAGGPPTGVDGDDEAAADKMLDELLAE